MYWGEPTDAVAAPTDQRWEKPVGFGEAYETSVAYGSAAKQVVSRDVQRYEEWRQFLEDIERRTGERINHPMAAGRSEIGEGLRRATSARLSKLRAERPDLALPEDPDAEIERRTDERLSSVVRAARVVEARPQTWGGLAGSMLGDVQTMITDPYQAPTLLFGAGVARGVLATAGIEAAIAASQTAGVIALNAATGDRPRVDPGFGIREAAGEIVGAGIGGAALGGGIKGLVRIFQRVKGSPEIELPRTVHDAANVAASDWQLSALTPRSARNPVEAEAVHREGVTRAVDAMLRDEPVQGELIPTGAAGRVFDSDGRGIDVRYEIVEARQLVTSHRDDLNPNPAFPAALQPRDRTRAASAEQVQEIASRLEPRRLGPSTDAATGAPIVGPDNIVESGNGRVLGIRRAYDGGTVAGDRYRAWLEAHGFDVAGIERPVMIARRVTPLDDGQRVAFTTAANRATAMRLSPVEQAGADARLLDGGLLDLAKAGDPAAAANRQFVREFFGRLPQSERAGLMDERGALSLEGRRRVEAALMARAYDDADLLGRALESTDNNTKAIGGGLNDSAAAWARMRDQARDGTIPGHMDITGDVLAAVRLVSRARDEGVKVADLARQAGLFGDDLTGTARAVLQAMFRDEQMQRPASRAAVARFLNDYAAEAQKNVAADRLFGEPLTARQIVEGLRDRPDLLAHLDAAAEPAAAARAIESPEASAAVLRELDQLRATRDFTIPVSEIDPASGEARIVMRSVDEIMQGLDDEARAAQLIQECAVGIGAAA